MLKELSINNFAIIDQLSGEEFDPALAKATVGAVRLISNNPRTVTEQDVIGILETNY